MSVHRLVGSFYDGTRGCEFCGEKIAGHMSQAEFERTPCPMGPVLVSLPEALDRPHDVANITPYRASGEGVNAIAPAVVLSSGCAIGRRLTPEAAEQLGKALIAAARSAMGGTE